MRVFIALELPQKTKENLCRSMQQLQDHATKGSFTAPENLHITLHFLGEVLPENLIYIQSAMDSIKDLPAPTLAINQISTLRASDVVCAKLKYDQQLLLLRSTLGDKLEQDGFDVEHRAYRPHVTLMRRYAFDLPFSEVVKGVKVYNMPFEGSQVVLYQSVLGKDGPTYTELYRVELQP